MTEQESSTAASTPDKDFTREIYRSMLRGRVIETKLSNLYKAGKIVGGVYLGKGQEAVSAALGTSLEWGKDVFAPLIRDQAGRMAFGEDPLDTTRTYLGSAKGPMRGRDGNIHRGRPADGLLAMISHLGAAVAQVGGALLAKRLKGELDGCVGATCIGDGATSTGAFHEGLNFVAVERLPMVVVVADNQFAYSTPTEKQYACDDLVDRAQGYGVAGHSVDGTDLFACAEVIGNAVAAARAGGGPQLVVAKLLRLTGHGEHDDGSYVPQEVRDGRYGRDCIEVGKAQLIERGWLSEEEYGQWLEEINEEAQSAVATAQREDGPNPYQEEWTAISSPSLGGLQ
ncbi:thiamine pyrophosphate-dependent dehydrogenase E1 component subunit alpha [Rubritalea tangerina]|uniref:2-oxoisovalerate dehydrogenase subunit alpha n=1 Tax=Rubritalea tangerina TaxID=430798 RepID=A0ABW4Z9L9_9BACT